MRTLKFVLLSALSLPFLQILIWYLGISFRPDLRQQFAMPGIDDGVAFTFVVYGVGQFMIAGFLGGLAHLASEYPIRVCRWLLFMEGVVGFLLFGLLLKSNWNFESNHCFGNDGCDLHSSLVFDFIPCVALGLPFIWCLNLMCTALFVRAPIEASQSN